VRHMNDPDLLASVCASLAIPKATTEAVSSFVLHAPLELLARAALLERVPAESRRLARRRIELLATLYSAEGEPLPAPRATPEVSLAEAIDAGDLAGIDGAAVALAATTGPAGIPLLLGDVVVDRLGAAGHANIFMALVTRHPSPAGASMLLRGLAREVGKHPDWRVQSTLPAVGSGDLAAACARLDPVGPAPRWGIYPLVAHAEEHGVVTALLDAVAADRVAARQTPPRPAAQGAHGAGAIWVDPLSDAHAGGPHRRRRGVIGSWRWRRRTWRATGRHTGVERPLLTTCPLQGPYRSAPHWRRAPPTRRPPPGTPTTRACGAS